MSGIGGFIVYDSLLQNSRDGTAVDKLDKGVIGAALINF